MTNDIRVVSSPDGGWMVALDEQSLAAFYGPDARILAESHRDVLVEILSSGDMHSDATDTSGDVWVH
jgi:hypothetical protein